MILKIKFFLFFVLVALSIQIPAHAKTQSNEWQELPRQSWEVQGGLDKKIYDDMGFERVNRARTVSQNSIQILPTFIVSKKLDVVGTIDSSPLASPYLGSSDIAFLKASEKSELMGGKTYLITGNPKVFDTHPKDLEGFAYHVLGTIRIENKMQGDLHVGTIQLSTDFIPRGAALVDFNPTVQLQNPIAGPDALEGIISVDLDHSTKTISSDKYAYIDLGTNDGIKPGMFFKAYLTSDTENERLFKPTTDVSSAELIVLHASENYSTLLVTDSVRGVDKGSKAILVTDISTLARFNRSNPPPTVVPPETDNELESLPIESPTPTDTPTPKDEEDDLDKLNDGLDSSQDEKKSLDQLELHKGEEPKNDPNNADPLFEETETPTTSESAMEPETDKELDFETESPDDKSTDSESDDFF
jgi:hypothetical protein